MRTVTKDVIVNVTKEKVPALKQRFFDQIRQISGEIERVDNEREFIYVRFSATDLKRFRFREVMWREYGNWWVFLEDKPEYYVWGETSVPLGGFDKPGVWHKAIALPLSREAANAILILMQREHPSMEFAVSIGKPSSFIV